MRAWFGFLSLVGGIFVNWVIFIPRPVQIGLGMGLGYPKIQTQIAGLEIYIWYILPGPGLCEWERSFALPNREKADVPSLPVRVTLELT